PRRAARCPTRRSSDLGLQHAATDAEYVDVVDELVHLIEDDLGIEEWEYLLDAVHQFRLGQLDDLLDLDHQLLDLFDDDRNEGEQDRKSTRLNSSHVKI